MKSKSIQREKILASNIFDKGSVYRNVKVSYNSKINRKIVPNVEICEDGSPKRKVGDKLLQNPANLRRKLIV